MKKIKLFALLGSLFAMVSCLDDLDNYQAPDAQFYGSIRDYQTNELIQQDIINGAQIEYIEHGYTNPVAQYMIFKPDGTFRNNLMFKGDYTVTPVRGNFVPVGPSEIHIEGETEHNFIVQPYLRIKNASIQKVGSKIIATFNVQQTVSHRVLGIGLYVHPEPSVGKYMNILSVEQGINAVVNENSLFTLEIDLPSHVNILVPGKQYFFRVGALIDAPEAKPNYAAAVRLAI
jgi:hypothetical protein